jgi:hypothetical protein
MLEKLALLNGVSEKIGVGLTMSRRWTDPPIQIMVSLIGGLVTMFAGNYYIATRVGPAYVALPLAVCFVYYRWVFLATPPADTEKYLIFKVRCPCRARRAERGHPRAGPCAHDDCAGACRMQR